MHPTACSGFVVDLGQHHRVHVPDRDDWRTGRIDRDRDPEVATLDEPAAYHRRQFAHGFQARDTLGHAAESSSVRRVGLCDSTMRRPVPPTRPWFCSGSSLGTTHEMWAPQVDVLAERFRVIAFDHRGHGESEVPTGPYTIDDLGGDVLELLDTLGVDQASYVGISLGGAVGLWLAENAPDRFHRFALLCPPASPADNARMWTDRAASVSARKAPKPSRT